MLSSDELQQLNDKTAEATTAMVREHPVVAPVIGATPVLESTAVSTTQNKISELLPLNE